MEWFGKYIFLMVLTTVLADCTILQAQTPAPKQTIKAKPKTNIVEPSKDSPASKEHPAVATLPQKDSGIVPNTNLWQLYTRQAGDIKEDAWFISKQVQRPSADYIFYLLAGLILILGFIRFMFPKYFGDLFGLFFRVTFKQKAIRERLLESTLPSLLLNGLFFISGGVFLYALSGYYQWQVKGNFWYGIGFWTGLLIIIYGLKWVILQIMGWLFQVKETSSTYTFIVFLVNKVLGVMLLPVVVLLMLGPVSIQPVLVTLVLFLLAALFIYRYIISYPGIRATVRVNQFHFFLYLCAFEIVPLLIIYKAMAMRLSIAT